MSAFSDILACRSLTVIRYKAELALESEGKPAARTALQAILECNVLDEIYAVAHEQLGQHQQARQLRDWLARN